MSNKKKIFIVIIVLVVLIIIYRIYSAAQKAKADQALIDQATNQVNGTITTGTGTPPPAKGNDNFPLERGSFGSNVVYLQNAINRIKPGAVKADGDFGPATYLALVTHVGTKYYPVTSAYFSEILQKANSK